MSAIRLVNVTKIYEGGIQAVNGVSLDINDGEFLVLVGPSGCGKSTLMRMIAGLEVVTDGVIEIGGHDVTSLPARRRDIAMVFQDYALYPHMSVRKNLGYGLKVRGTPRKEVSQRVESVATMLGLDVLLERRPGASLAVSASVWPWAGRSFASPKSFSWTNHCRIWMQSCVFRCGRSSGACTRGSVRPRFM